MQDSLTPSSAPDPATASAEIESALIPYANRLCKRARHFRKWAKREGLTAFRVYDRDMPEFPFTVECLGGKVVLSVYERQAPEGQEPTPAYTPDELRAVTARTLGVAESAVYLKTRERQKGANQYEPLSAERHEEVVEEGALRFLVNVSDYLDNGLFLDHRPWRARLLKEAKGLRVLNLFVYTGSLSVAAAKGGAYEVVSVDLSNTYLAWARRNLAQNGIGEANTPLVRADILAQIPELRRRHERFDLILLDPPSFSNSKKMHQSFDVQRDHAALIASLRGLLMPEGRLWFSTNRKGFRLDKALLESFSALDLTAKSTPPDFPYSRPHKAFELSRRAAG